MSSLFQMKKIVTSLIVVLIVFLLANIIVLYSGRGSGDLTYGYDAELLNQDIIEKNSIKLVFGNGVDNGIFTLHNGGNSNAENLKVELIVGGKVVEEIKSGTIASTCLLNKENEECEYTIDPNSTELFQISGYYDEFSIKASSGEANTIANFKGTPKQKKDFLEEQLNQPSFVILGTASLLILIFYFKNKK